MKKVQFTKLDLSTKAYEWYQGCSCEITEENGIYYMDGDKMGCFDDLQEAFKIYQDEFENAEIEELIEEILQYELPDDRNFREFLEYVELGGLFYRDTNLLTKETEYCQTDDAEIMHDFYEISDKNLSFDFYLNKVSLDTLKSFLAYAEKSVI